MWLRLESRLEVRLRRQWERLRVLLRQALYRQAPVRGLLLVLVERLARSSVWVGRLEVRVRVRVGGCEMWVI